LEQFPDHFELFWWLGTRLSIVITAIRWRPSFAAIQLLADVFDALLAAKYSSSDFQEWVTRLLFCVFLRTLQGCGTGLGYQIDDDQWVHGHPPLAN
jgi:hypothetical protein